jgi:hypothetical protein
VERRSLIHACKTADGMTDTGFHVPAGKLDRLTTSYWTDPESGTLRAHDQAENSLYSRPPAVASGGGGPSSGLVTTIDD